MISSGVFISALVVLAIGLLIEVDFQFSIKDKPRYDGNDFFRVAGALAAAVIGRVLIVVSLGLCAIAAVIHFSEPIGQYFSYLWELSRHVIGIK